MSGTLNPGSQSGEPQTVRAVVTASIPRRQIGFARIHGERGKNGRAIEVCFRMDKCREAYWVPTSRTWGFKLTPAPCNVAVGDQILMRVRWLPDRGLYPVAWSLQPKHDWKAEAASHDGFVRFVGRMVTSARESGNRFPGREYRGVLLRVELDGRRISLTLGSPLRLDKYGRYRPMGELPELTLSYPLDSAMPVSIPDGYGILIRETYGRRRYNRLIALGMPR